MDIMFLVESLVKSIIVDENVLLIVVKEHPYQWDIILRVNPKDVGKLVGKKGKTISAIRNIIDMVTSKDGNIQYSIWVEGMTPSSTGEKNL